MDPNSIRTEKTTRSGLFLMLLVIVIVAGSGVVAKSNDQYELEECNNKLGALVKAIKQTDAINS